jgi:hypothetical protein
MEYLTDTSCLNFATHGAERFDGAVAESLSDLRSAFEGMPRDRAGVRISGLATLSPSISATGPIGSIAATILGPPSRPVRAILFDKTAETNWSLGWHQDRTICVKQRIDVDGFEIWTMKGGMQHVAPPFELLARMVTLRVHLDPVASGNAPLLIAPGSHTLGRIPVDAIHEIVRQCGTYACFAEAGDVWVYATPIVHASDAPTEPTHRRVLQLDYAAEDLPGGLEWLGV